MAEVAVTLDGVTLNSNMRWLEQFRPQVVAAEATRTIGGRYVVFTQGLLLGQKITLEATEEQGWADMDLATVQAIKTRAETPGWTGTLSIGSDNYTVRFRHDEPPAFDAQPMISRLSPDAGDLFRMTIKLVVTA